MPSGSDSSSSVQQGHSDMDSGGDGSDSGPTDKEIVARFTKVVCIFFDVPLYYMICSENELLLSVSYLTNLRILDLSDSTFKRHYLEILHNACYDYSTDKIGQRSR
jgi:hypothetical protein